MILAYIVYIGLMCFMMTSTGYWFYHKNSVSEEAYWGVRTLIPIFIFSLIIGLRYNVGLDYMNYHDVYVEQSSFDMPWDKYEPGFVLINKLLYSLHFPPWIFFMSIACLQICFFYKIFKNKPYMLPIAIFLLFIMGNIFSMLNIIRHYIAACIILFGIRYVVQKDTVWKFIICVLCAMLFHLSAIVTLPIAILCLFPKPVFIENRIILIIILLLIILFQENFATFIINNALEILFNVDVSNMQDIAFNTNKLSYAVGQFTIDEGSGFGRYINYIIVILFIIISKHLYKLCGTEFLQYFRVYYIGQLFIISVGLDMNLRRLGMYYSFASIIVFTYFLYHIFSSWKKISPLYQLLTFILIGYYIVLFMYKIYIGESGCSPWQFI